MHLRFSVREPGGLAVDVEVSASPDSLVGPLLDALPVAIRGRSCYVGNLRLDPRSTVADSGLVQGATITVGEPGLVTAARPRAAAGALQVIGGPDRGHVVWLIPGVHRLGRSSGSAVTLSDPNVSRAHAQVEVSGSGDLVVTDLGSANGTRINDVRIPEPVRLRPEDVLEVGDDRLRWLPLSTTRLRTVRAADGRLEFDRAFTSAPAIPTTKITLPSSETEEPSGTMITSLATGLAPVGMGVVMAMTMGQPLMLLLALLFPVGFAVPMIIERRQRKARARKLAWRQEAIEKELDAHILVEERLRRELAPDQLELTLAAQGDTQRLWPRTSDSPDGLVVRIGVTDQPAQVELQGDPWPEFVPPVVRDVPVTVDLRTIGVLGVIGPGKAVGSLMRWLLVQLSTLRAPDGLHLVVISSGDGSGYSWTSWLPHIGGEASVPCQVGNTDETRAARIEELTGIVAARKDAARQSSATRFPEEIVVILDGALALRQIPGMKEILREGPAVGVYVICADQRSMGEAVGLCELDNSRIRLTRGRGDQPVTVQPEGIGPGPAERVGRALAPMRDRLASIRNEGAIPDRTRFLDLLGIGTPAVDDVLELWRARPGPTTEVPLGADADGVVTVDLHEQGPHAMLGGATGAGKSILLQTLVTSLLLANRPDELNLVLVDFKGGGAFLPFENCPHVVGLIRSTGDTAADVFDEAAADRVLASVRTEVNRRESILAPYGGEIDGYWKASDPSKPPLPRLVMIFDEFARVLEVSPDFLQELVNVSAKGRSLGMHLILATQSLQGKLSAELKNNISLRISLRQNEPSESTEVLEVPDAAQIPGRLRGRGMILCTKDDRPTPHVLQSGYLGDPPPSGRAEPVNVRVADWFSLGAPRPEERIESGGAETDQELAIKAIIGAAARLDLPAPFRPVLPPLPASLVLDVLDCAPVSPSAAPYGITDDPAGQAQPAAALDLAGTERLMCAGGPQSGRTTFARTLITSLVGRFSADQVHIYVIEHEPAGLASLDDLPHCGGVFSPAEPDRIRRFVTWLDGEVQRRKAARFDPSAAAAVPIVVVVDGWEYFEDRSDPMWEETSLLPAMRGIISAGTPIGVHVVAIGGQTMMNGRLPDLYSRRLLLPFPQEEIRRMFLSSGTVSPPVLPGRAIEAASRFQVQVCTPATGHAGTEGLASTVGRMNGPAGAAPKRPPVEFPSLPVRLALDELAAGDDSGTWVPLGVGGLAASPVGVDLYGGASPLMLVSGPPRSGRSTAAATVAHGLRRAGIGVLAVAPPRSPLPGMLPSDEGVRVVTGLSIKDAALQEAAADFGDGRFAVVVDDCEQITVIAEEVDWQQSPTLLDEITGPESIGRQALVLCGDAGPILFGQRPSLRTVVDHVMTSGTRLLLTPTSNAIARDHGITLEPDQFFSGPPGRGYLTAGRGAHLIQLAQRLIAE